MESDVPEPNMLTFSFISTKKYFISFSDTHLRCMCEDGNKKVKENM